AATAAGGRSSGSRRASCAAPSRSARARRASERPWPTKRCGHSATRDPENASAVRRASNNFNDHPMHKTLKPRDGGDKTPIGPLSEKAARKRATRAPVTTGNHVPERAADPAKQSSRHLRPRTAEEIANEQTAEQLALRVFAAMVGEKALSSMSALMDELLQSHLLDDDDEEADEGWLDDHHKREKRFLDEAISDGLDKFPDFAAINNLPPNSDPDVARDAGQLKDVLTKCAIGATEFKEKFPRAQLERMVKRDLKTRFEKDPKYSKHVREDVPGLDVKAYGSRGR